MHVGAVSKRLFYRHLGGLSRWGSSGRADIFELYLWWLKHKIPPRDLFSPPQPEEAHYGCRQWWRESQEATTTLSSAFSPPKKCAWPRKIANAMRESRKKEPQRGSQQPVLKPTRILSSNLEACVWQSRDSEKNHSSKKWWRIPSLGTMCRLQKLKMITFLKLCLQSRPKTKLRAEPDPFPIAERWEMLKLVGRAENWSEMSPNPTCALTMWHDVQFTMYTSPNTMHRSPQCDPARALTTNHGILPWRGAGYPTRTTYKQCSDTMYILETN